MTKNYLAFIVCLFISGILSAQIINFTDPNFKQNLLDANPSIGIAADINGDFITIDSNGDNEISIAEALEVHLLSLGQYTFNDMTGIEFFTNLNYLALGAPVPRHDLTTLDVSALTNLQELWCLESGIEDLNVTGLSNLTTLICRINNLSDLDLMGCNSLEVLDASSNQLNSFDFSGPNSLVELYVNDNPFTTANLNALTNLTIFHCGEGGLETLEATGAASLTEVVAAVSPLSSVNITGLSNLESINFLNCQLTDLDLTGLSQLDFLQLGNNSITSIDFSTTPLVEGFNLQNNSLTEIDLSPLNLLEFAIIFGNQLTEVSTMNNSVLSYLDVHDNNLQYLLLKDGIDSEEITLHFGGNPNIEYICADSFEIEYINELAIDYGYSGYFINTYCSFDPGGEFYVIQGENKFDPDLDGCDTSDPNIPYFAYEVTGQDGNGTVISDETGQYSIPLQAGVYMISPLLENPSFFNVSPETVSVDFPTDPSPFDQNFCIEPEGVHPDVEIVLIPVDPAVPGFDADYQLIYRNSGNQILSGSVDFIFEDELMDVVATNPVPNSQNPGFMTWDYTDLLPFEVRTIDITFNINAPTDTPPVDVGDLLTFSGVVEPVASDETPGNNEIVFEQIVVGPFDPNDKTCLLGEAIQVSEVGDFVYYLIRFENLGTFPAQNVVITDIIDETKFDISTMIPIQGSHNFITRITDNLVEFIFEGINLPFQQGSNQGYVLFKIKTDNNLQIGDVFSNSANIYFDFNLPIETNLAETIVEENLATEGFDFLQGIFVYPNPTESLILLKNTDDIQILNLDFYNHLGQKIKSFGLQESIDISEFEKGVYFLQISSNRGDIFKKVIKI